MGRTLASSPQRFASGAKKNSSTITRITTNFIQLFLSAEISIICVIRIQFWGRSYGTPNMGIPLYPGFRHPFGIPHPGLQLGRPAFAGLSLFYS
jgi:hypothetical protein